MAHVVSCRSVRRLILKCLLCSLGSICFGPGRVNRVVAQESVPTAGVSFWLDIQRLEASQDSSDDGHASPIAKLPDSSGNGREFLQFERSQQPNLIQLEGGKVLRFDGQDDSMRFLGPSQSLRSAHLFLMVTAHENPGDFRGFIAANAKDRRDYESGFNVDLGPGPSWKWDNINVEGNGFGGARDLLDESLPFGTLHLIEVVIDGAQKQIQLFVDGKPKRIDLGLQIPFRWSNGP